MDIFYCGFVRDGLFDVWVVDGGNYNLEFFDDVYIEIDLVYNEIIFLVWVICVLGFFVILNKF